MKNSPQALVKGLLDDLQAWGRRVEAVAQELERLAEEAEPIVGNSADYTYEGYAAAILSCPTFFPDHVADQLQWFIADPEEVKTQIRYLAREDAISRHRAS